MFLGVGKLGVTAVGGGGSVVTFCLQCPALALACLQHVKQVVTSDQAMAVEGETACGVTEIETNQSINQSFKSETLKFMWWKNKPNKSLPWGSA